ncbi:hypothetical protein CMI37_14730 [Candidatus Pacearchaeota archaeon]|nr:hypothetical protein [Candidatus Pacearchaeota archaeon]|tara:strand:- start:329 stop:1066 length:738 start_codon:yes stop_codon:yes gene_type:complete
MDVYVLTSDKTLFLMEIFQYLFNKYWGSHQQVKVLGYKPPEDFSFYDNFSFISQGKDVGPDTFTNEKKIFFEKTKEDFFIMLWDDLPPISPVDFQILDYLKGQIRSSPDVGKISLTGSPENDCKSYKTLKESDRFDLIEIPQDDQWKLSVMNSIWRKDYFLQYCLPYHNPWKFEIECSKLSHFDGVRVLASSKKYAMDIAQLHRRGSVAVGPRHYWFKRLYGPAGIMSPEDLDFCSDVLRKCGKI